MDKTRLEALSDGVFAIAMTLLIFNVTVPILSGTVSDYALSKEIYKRIPVFVSYFVSFAVLATFWISHNFFYSSFTKTVNRKLVLLNMLYLAFLAFIPFTTRLLGEYYNLKTAVVLYGLNVFAIGIIASSVLHYAIYSDEIDTSHITSRQLNHTRVRSLLTPVCTLLGIISAYFNTPIALFLFAFPILFNLVPGSLTFVARMIGAER